MKKALNAYYSLEKFLGKLKDKQAGVIIDVVEKAEIRGKKILRGQEPRTGDVDAICRLFYARVPENVASPRSTTLVFLPDMFLNQEDFVEFVAVGICLLFSEGKWEGLMPRCRERLKERVKGGYRCSQLLYATGCFALLYSKPDSSELAFPFPDRMDIAGVISLDSRPRFLVPNEPDVEILVSSSEGQTEMLAAFLGYRILNDQTAVDKAPDKQSSIEKVSQANIQEVEDFSHYFNLPSANPLSRSREEESRNDEEEARSTIQGDLAPVAILSPSNSKRPRVSDTEDSLPNIQDFPKAQVGSNDDKSNLNDYLGESPPPLDCHSEVPLTPGNSQASSSSFIRIATSNILTRKYVRLLEAAELQDEDFQAENAGCTVQVLRELLQMSEECAKQVVKIISKGLLK